MIHFVMTYLWMSMELFCLDILADAFLKKKKLGMGRSKRVATLLFLTLVMSASVMLLENVVIPVSYTHLWHVLCDR